MLSKVLLKGLFKQIWGLKRKKLRTKKLKKILDTKIKFDYLMGTKNIFSN